ncbi:MAG: bacillithiol biosynthesis cysteine-adding enzyme BshC [Polyangiales bacterium]
MAATLFDAYLAGEARAFFPAWLGDPDARERAVRASQRPLSSDVLACLREQNQRLGPSSARNAHLAELEAGARVVVTGQQVGLFLGPLYTVYKAASAIRLARRLREETGTPVVPLFWLQTEDHDLPEIARAVVPRADEAPLVLAPEIDAGNRRSIAQLTLPAAVSGCLEQLRLELEPLPHGPDHLAKLGQHYAQGRGWGEAFAGLLAELFEPEGLLVLDPRDRRLAQRAEPIYRQVIERAPELEHALVAGQAALEQAGFATTIHVRRGSPLCFYHPEGAQGARVRLQVTRDGYLDPSSQERHSQRDLLQALERDPLTFSSSALLRPIIQDTLLPTAAYVGGPAEVAYFAQLPPLYAAFGVPPPLIAPRARLCLLERRCSRGLAQLGLTPQDISRGEDTLLAELSAAAPTSALPSAEAFELALGHGLERVLGAALFDLPDAMRRQLGPQIDKTRAKLQLSTHKLSRHYGSALARTDEQRVALVRRLGRLLYPEGAPQERVFGISYFAARYGARALIERVLSAIDPYVATPLELHL